MVNHSYPQNPSEWRLAIRAGIGLSMNDAQKSYLDGTFPFIQLEQWIRATFQEGFVSDFVPALLRNIKGLVSWVYENGPEPNWRESDSQYFHDKNQLDSAPPCR